jgi:HAD superfamily hydrolase (TIGR01509 family)
MWIKGAIMPIKAILFDHDGTLVDSESTHLAMWRKALEPYNANITDDEYWTRLLGVPAEENARLLIEMCDLKADIPTLVEAKMLHTTQHLTHTPFPKIAGADHILSTLWDRARLAMVSGSQRVCINATLKGHQWEDYFDVVVTGDDVPNNKPHPDSYLKALEQLGVPANQAVAIEDTESGVKAAAAAGIPVIAVRNVFSKAHDFSLASQEVESLARAQAWIEERLA